MQKIVQYQFEDIEECNLCKANSNNFKVLGKRLNQSQGRSPASKYGISVTIMKCGNCGLIFSNPQPTPLLLQDHYKVPPEEYWPDDYFAMTNDDYQHIINLVQQKLGSNAGGAMTLDIGAGIGKAMQAFEKNGFKSHGLEPSETFCEMAISRQGIDSSRITCQSIEDASYPHNSFDFISFDAVLEHLPDPSSAITKSLDWLKPGGFIFIAVPSSNWLTTGLINTWYGLTRGDYVSNLSPMHKPYHLYEFSIESFKEHSRLYNYTIEHYQYNVCQTFLPKFLDPIVKPYMEMTNTGMDLALWIQKQN